MTSPAIKLGPMDIALNKTGFRITVPEVDRPFKVAVTTTLVSEGTNLCTTWNVPVVSPFEILTVEGKVIASEFDVNDTTESAEGFESRVNFPTTSCDVPPKIEDGEKVTALTVVGLIVTDSVDKPPATDAEILATVGSETLFVVIRNSATVFPPKTVTVLGIETRFESEVKSTVTV